MKSLWEFHQAGDAARVTHDHDGCGAAIRVAPVGILYRSQRLDAIVAGAREASIPTHGGPLALAAAAATAAAMSAAIDGAQPHEIIELAQRAAARAECERSGSRNTVFAAAIRAIHGDLQRRPELNAADVATRSFPDAPLTIVPLAILGARCPETVNEKWYSAVEAVNDHRLTALGEALSALRH